MLIDFKVRNFLSFEKEEVFSLVAGKGRNFNERLYQNGSNKILKFSSLFGANGSGKSNFVKAISFSRDYIIRGNDRATIQKYNKINPNCKESTSSFEYKISIDQKIYTYGFEILLSKNEVVAEWLYLKNVINATTNIPITKNIIFFLLCIKVFLSDLTINGIDAIINPKNNEFILGEYFRNNDLRNRLNIISDSISSNNGILFLKAVSTYNNLFSEHSEAIILKEVFWWFEINLKVKKPDSIISDYAYFMSEKNMDSILKFFKDFDLSISNYNFFECPKEQIALKLPKEIFEDLVSRIEKDLIDASEKFTDVNKNAWYYNEILKAIN